MRLLKTFSVDSPLGLELIDINPNAIPPYAILSHTWSEQEVLYADVIANTAKEKDGYHKIEYTCRQAIVDGYEYAWADNCCIDKGSSAELSEAINSMYEWYRQAGTCYAYLTDCAADVEVSKVQSQFRHSRWFTRGWTLQELIAPANLVFFAKGWVKIGEKKTLSTILSRITNIDEDILIGARPLESASVAKRMSWASNRETTRPEDIAYCLLGMFGVSMPMLYGEGDKAFLRLQEEIMKQSDDQSLFAWVDTAAPSDSRHGLLAQSPALFRNSNSIVPYEDWEPRAPYSMTNRGLRIELHLALRENDIYVAAIDCPSPPDYQNSSFLALYLQKVSDGDEQYARVKVGHFAKVYERGNLRSIFIRQDAGKRQHGIDGVFPNHVLQLRQGPDASVYTLKNVVGPPESASEIIEAITSSRGSPREWIPKEWALTYKLSKGANQLSLGLVFSRIDEERLLVMLGSGEGLKLAFDAVELPVSFRLTESDNSNEVPISSFGEMRKSFKPTLTGQYVELDYHKIRVDSHPMVYKSAKYYFIDIKIESSNPSSRVSEAIDLAWRIMRSREQGLKSREEREEEEVKKKKGWRRILTS